MKTTHDTESDLVDIGNFEVISYTQENHYLISDIVKIFNADKNAIIRAEKDKTIPHSIRVKKGKIEARAWTVEQLPAIGKVLGFIKADIKDPQVISLFTLKGGTLKTSIAFQISRILALHGYKVCVIGLDVQESITDIIKGQKKNIDNNEQIDFEDDYGLYHILTEGKSIDETIRKTDLPTLFYIPETFELSLLDKWLKLQRNQEHIFKSKIVKELKNKFDFIVFDCNPSWDTIVDNALDCTNILLSPMTCSADTYRAMRRFNEMIELWIDENDSNIIDLFKIIPTRKRNTKVSGLVEAKYRSNYSNLCSSNSIRDAVLAEASNSLGKSIIEIVDKKNDLRTDYENLLIELTDEVSKLEVIQ